MLLLIAYVLLVSCLLSLAALAAEHALTRWPLPRRIVWITALLLSVGWPTYAVLSRSAEPAVPSDTAALQAGAATDASAGPPGSEIPSAGTPLADLNWSRWTGLSRPLALERAGSDRLDALLRVAWIASSVVVFALYFAASIGLRFAARRWQTVRIDDCEVLVSERLGPAMFGMASPRIVLPRWLMDAEPEVRRFVLHHENEHIAARDQVVLTVAMFLVSAAPWNPLLWFQLSRLRLAVETDCDARVLRRDADAAAYARTLLTVGRHRSAAPIAAIALMEPTSRLEQRIRRVLNPARSRGALVFVACLAASGLVAAATIADAPLMKGAQVANHTSTDMSNSGADSMKVPTLIASMLAATGAQAQELDPIPQQWAQFMGSGPALGPGSDGMPRSCTAGVDSQLAAAGQPNMTVQCSGSSVPGFNGLNQRFTAESFRGKRVRFSAYLRAQGISDATSFGETVPGMGGLWFRIGENVANHLVRDDMSDRGLRGDVEWAPYEIVADVPENAAGISIGFWMQGQGQIWISNISFEEVGKDVPVTAPPFGYNNGPSNLNLK